MIFLLDNYDSFTYNLAHMLYALKDDVEIRRNREVTVDEVLAMRPEAIVLSPGPGRPVEAGIMLDLIKRVYQDIPIFGVCLGHQAIGEAFGANIINAKKIMHGKISPLSHDNKGLFEGIKSPFRAVRYHSLAIERATLSDDFEITCEDEEGEIMGIRHKKYLIEGIQYHPESVLTTSGKKQISNFISMVENRQRGGF